MEDEKMKFLTFKLLDGWGNQKTSQIVEKISMTSPYPRAKNRKNMNGGMAWAGEEEGDKRLTNLVPVGPTNRWLVAPTSQQAPSHWT
jgi:hypothetical protein